MNNKISAAIKESIAVKESVAKNEVANIESAARAIIGSLKNGGKVLIFGNGGSAADSQHFAAELVGRFKKERKALGAIALSVDTSALTAISNDYGYEASFARQVEALGKAGDIAFGISTSGNSANVIAGLQTAQDLGCFTIALLGKDGGALRGQCDHEIIVEASGTDRIQEVHTIILHILIEAVESILFPELTSGQPQGL